MEDKQEKAPNFQTHLHMLGCENLISRHITSYLCSRGHVPDEHFKRVVKWIDSLDPKKDVIMVGYLNGLERFALKQLEKKKIPIILMLCEALPDSLEDLCRMVFSVVEIDLATAISEDRLLILSVNDDREDCIATSENAALRNQWMLSFAAQTVVGYVRKDGNLAQQIKGRENVRLL